MNDQTMGKAGPFLGRQQAIEIFFNLGRILMSGETQAARQAPAVGVDGDAGRLKRVSKNHIGGFPTDPS